MKLSEFTTWLRDVWRIVPRDIWVALVPPVSNPRGRHWAGNLEHALDVPTLLHSLRLDIVPTAPATPKRARHRAPVFADIPIFHDPDLIEAVTRRSSVSPVRARDWFSIEKPPRALTTDAGLAILAPAGPMRAIGLRELVTAGAPQSSARESAPPRDTARRTGAHRLADLGSQFHTLLVRDVYVTGALHTIRSYTQRALGETTWRESRKADAYA